jgi:pilus assembly protein CpaE
VNDHDGEAPEPVLGRSHRGSSGAGQEPFGDRASSSQHDPVHLLIVDRKASFAGDVERAAHLLERVPKVVVETHPTRLLEQVAAEPPDVILVAPEEMTATGLRRLAQVHRAAPRCLIVLTQLQGAAPIPITEAAACGAGDALTYPATAIKLRHALGRILAKAEARAEQVVVREAATQVPAPAPVADQAPGAPASAKVFTVTSPTGGCGKTFFATNLAAYLAGATGGRVLLVDLDLQFGEVSLALGLRPQRTISELISEESLRDAFPDYVVEHSAGYKVLSAPADPFAAELVGPREATQVLEAARALFDYVVVDTPPSLNEVVLAAFDQSRYLVVMATMDVPSLRNLKVFLETIDRLKLPAEDVSCVLNKAESDNGIDLEELLRVYPGGFAAVLPYAKEVSRSLNAGQPVMVLDPKAEVSEKIREACLALVPAQDVKVPWPAAAAGRGHWLERRRQRRDVAGGRGPGQQMAPAGPGHSGPVSGVAGTFREAGTAAAIPAIDPWQRPREPALAAAAGAVRDTPGRVGRDAGSSRSGELGGGDPGPGGHSPEPQWAPPEPPAPDWLAAEPPAPDWLAAEPPAFRPDLSGGNGERSAPQLGDEAFFLPAGTAARADLEPAPSAAWIAPGGDLDRAAGWSAQPPPEPAREPAWGFFRRLFGSSPPRPSRSAPRHRFRG